MQPAVVDPKVEVPPTMIVLQPIVSQLVVTIEKQMLCLSISDLTPPMFVGALCEDAFEFLTICK